jgi:hypothetical protein
VVLKITHQISEGPAAFIFIDEMEAEVPQNGVIIEQTLSSHCHENL